MPTRSIAGEPNDNGNDDDDDGRAMVWASSIKVILMGRRQTDLGSGKSAGGWVGR